METRRPGLARLLQAGQVLLRDLRPELRRMTVRHHLKRCRAKRRGLLGQHQDSINGTWIWLEERLAFACQA